MSANKTVTESRSKGTYGQNLAVSGGSGNVRGDDPLEYVKGAITSQWYGEIKDFTSLFGQKDIGGSIFESVGHFTQLMWKGTTEVGCAVQFCPSGTIFNGMDSWYTVCNYFPPGMHRSISLVARKTRC